MPLKRDKNIQILSREHHHGLLFCWKIKTGIKNAVDPKRIVAYVHFFWDGHLKTHFKEEEDLLFCTVEDPLCKKTLRQHDEIRSLLLDLNATYDTLAELITNIEAHIRFEERELFPHLEKSLTAQELLSIGSALEKCIQHPLLMITMTNSGKTDHSFNGPI